MMELVSDDIVISDDTDVEQMIYECDLNVDQSATLKRMLDDKNRVPQLYGFEKVEEQIKSQFQGYHVQINFWGTGGTIDAMCCDCEGINNEKCYSVRWNKSNNETLQTAVLKLRQIIK